jgi:hypothetical protein
MAAVHLHYKNPMYRFWLEEPKTLLLHFINHIIPSSSSSSSFWNITMRPTLHITLCAAGLLSSLCVRADPVSAWQGLLALRDTAEALAPFEDPVRNVTIPVSGAKVFTRRYEASYPKGQPRPAQLKFKVSLWSKAYFSVGKVG